MERKPQRNIGRPLTDKHIDAIRAAKLAKRAAELYKKALQAREAANV
jgi:hypothetical protein